ncbi:MAG: 50S ribosomal protein L4 [Candidatus Shikimatogenerans sp. JK-2022]|nr:50S ribosomal protein L4 [Candidatus Shikimatogenerans bostrichidophilus]
MINSTKIIKENYNLFEKYNKIKNKDHIIYLYFKKYLNNQRLGNSKTKERSEIKGSNKKILKQKGTGNARKGDIKNPIFRGGGRIFGPKKYKKQLKINKNIEKKVYKILISNKILNNKVFFIKTFKLLNFKTKTLIIYLKKKNIKIDYKKKKYLFLTDKIYKNLLISSRNIKNFLINYILNINYFNFFIYDYIIFIGKNIDKYIINNIIKK